MMSAATAAFQDETRVLLRARRSGATAVTQAVLINTLDRIIPELISQADRKDIDAASYCWQALHIVSDLDYAMRDDQPLQAHRRLWAHAPNPTVARFKEGRHVDREGIETATARYLRYDWYSDHLDWCIIDALAFWEYEAFARVRLAGSVMMGRITYGMWAIIGAALLWLNATKVPPVAWWMIGFLAFLIVAKRWLTKLENRKPIQAMKKTYRELDGAALSPIRVREQFQAAEKDGVVWPNMIWPVLDRVISRNPTVWRAWPR
jgi:hypothetical protein